MHCPAVIYTCILVKMSKIETLLQLRKSQEVSARYIIVPFSVGSILKSSGQTFSSRPHNVKLDPS